MVHWLNPLPSSSNWLHKHQQNWWLLHHWIKACDFPNRAVCNCLKDHSGHSDVLCIDGQPSISVSSVHRQQKRGRAINTDLILHVEDLLGHRDFATDHDLDQYCAHEDTRAACVKGKEFKTCQWSYFSFQQYILSIVKLLKIFRCLIFSCLSMQTAT